MNYKEKNNECQMSIDDFLKEESSKINYLKIPSTLERFNNTSTEEKEVNNHDVYFFKGYIEPLENELICPCCGNKMHIHGSNEVSVKHVPIGGKYSYVVIKLSRLKCDDCKYTGMQKIPFIEKHHYITKTVKTYVEDLLATNNFNNKEVAYLTGLNRNLVKEIDKERLIKKYTIDGKGEELIKPKVQATYLGIDEFKLHNGYKYATHIIDYNTGHILWIAEGKKKQVVYDFINHVGLEWMNNVKAVACDMNSDFEEAFKEKCPHIKIVYDYFHIVKNFNEKVINKIRIDEQERLKSEGKEEDARKLKHSKLIISANIETLVKRDKESDNGKVLSKSSTIFNKNEVKRKGGKLDKFYEIVNNNEIFLLLEIIKEILNEAYKCNDEEEMSKLIFDIMELCEESGNKHLLWFKRLLYNHFDGIISHATIKISSGKIEGINNKIKTLRRQAYGYPDDEYFFLKLFDMSRN